MVLDIPPATPAMNFDFLPQTTCVASGPEKSKFKDNDCLEKYASSFNSRGFRGPGTRNQTLDFVSICACWDETAV